MHSIAYGTQLALRIRDGSYRPDHDMLTRRHRQTPTVLGDFRFPAAVASCAAAHGRNKAINLAIELSGSSKLTRKDAVRWINQITKF